MRMKRLIAGLLGVALVFVLAGCHKEEDARLEAEAQAKAEAARKVAEEQAKQAAEAAKASGATAGGVKAAEEAAKAAASGGSGPTGSANPMASSGQSKSSAPLVTELVKLDNLKKGDTAKFGPYAFTLTDIYVMQQAPGFPEGWSFVLFEIHFKNGSRDLVLVNQLDHFKFYDSSGKSYKVNSQALAQRNPTMGGNVRAGEELKGWLGYLLKIQPDTEYILSVQLPGLGFANFKLSL